MISAQTLLDALRKAGLDESTERQLIEDPAYAEMVVITAKLERLKTWLPDYLQEKRKEKEENNTRAFPKRKGFLFNRADQIAGKVQYRL